MDASEDGGHGPGFDRLYRLNRVRIYATIRGIVLDPAEAEDLAQETFQRAFRCHQRHDLVNPDALLHRIAVNVAIGHLRRRRLTRLLPFRLFSGGRRSDFDRVEAPSPVTQALAGLSPKLRVVVVLTCYGEMTGEQIADVLQVPPGTVASRLAAAMNHMRRMLSDVDGALFVQEGARGNAS